MQLASVQSATRVYIGLGTIAHAALIKRLDTQSPSPSMVIGYRVGDEVFIADIEPFSRMAKALNSGKTWDLLPEEVRFTWQEGYRAALEHFTAFQQVGWWIETDLECPTNTGYASKKAIQDICKPEWLSLSENMIVFYSFGDANVLAFEISSKNAIRKEVNINYVQ